MIVTVDLKNGYLTNTIPILKTVYSYSNAFVVQGLTFHALFFFEFQYQYRHRYYNMKIVYNTTWEKIYCIGTYFLKLVMRL